MKDYLFVVTREGVYRHEIVAVTRDLSTAVEKAHVVASHERDDYHFFDVSRIELDTISKDVELVARVFWVDIWHRHRPGPCLQELRAI
jgi:hypothetical protein